MEYKVTKTVIMRKTVTLDQKEITDILTAHVCGLHSLPGKVEVHFSGLEFEDLSAYITSEHSETFFEDFP